MFCDKCGRKLQDDAAFCPYCGRKMSDPESETLPEKVDPHSEKQDAGSGKYVSVRLPRKHVVGKVLCVIAAALILVGIFQITSSRYRSMIEFYNECVTNRADLGYNQYSLRLYPMYDDWIADYGRMIRECRVKAAVLGTLGLACGAAGIYLNLTDKRRKRHE